MDLIGSVLSFIGGERRNQAQQEIADNANTFSAQQFASRYQTTTADMKAAGLNPMIAYSQGGGSPPTGQQAQMQDTITPAVQLYNQSRLNSAQVANVEADTENKQAQSDLIKAQTGQSTASAVQAQAQTSLINETVSKVKQEVVNLTTDNERSRAVIENLRVEYQNLVKQGYNLTEVGNQIRATISKMSAEIPNIHMQTIINDLEGKLKQYDVNASKTTGGLGSYGAHLKPILDILRTLKR